MAELAWENIIKNQRDVREEKPRKTGCTMVMDVGKGMYEPKVSCKPVPTILTTGNSALAPPLSWTSVIAENCTHCAHIS